jgi:hypothetical protein
MRPIWSKLLLALRDPGAMAGFESSDWDLVVRQAAHAGLLGRLGAMARQAEVHTAMPAPVWRHLEATLARAEQRRLAVRWELVHLSRDLADLPGPVLLLKGAAYAAANLAPAAGRMFSDIDLLVPKSQLDEAESLLMLSGWLTSQHSDYDQRYYRQWMHELPPMTHIKRQTLLDLHHNILPETARIKTRPDLILAEAQVLQEFPCFSIPSAADQILHSATHLFHEGDWGHGLRDLVDLDQLLRDYAKTDGFWAGLLERARVLGLGRPLYYGLSLCLRLLATPVPTQALLECPDRPQGLKARWMEFLFLNALSMGHKPSSTRFAAWAEFALYLRSHYLRMPLHLLLPHLLAKGWQRVQDSIKSEVEPPDAPKQQQ